MGFYGDCSHYVELPKPDEIYDYEKYTNPNYLLENNDLTIDNTDNESDNIDNSNNDFKFVL